MINPRRLKQSLAHALRGVKVVFTSEQNFRIQVLVAIVVIAAAIFFGVTSNEFILIILLIGAVLTLEMINSVLERIVDSFKPRIHPIVKDIKDIMAGVVFLVSLIAVLVGIEIFDAYIYALVVG